LKGLVQKAAADRLGSTLFAAALFHGMVVLGVSFSPEDPNTLSDPTVEVVMLTNPDTREYEPEQAEYLAQANQEGAGTTLEATRPTSGNPQQVFVQGEPEASEPDQARDTESPSNQPVLAARAKDQAALQIDPEMPAEASEEKRQAMDMTPSEQAAMAEVERATHPEITGRPTKEMFVAVNTRQSDVAEYLVKWKQKIERVGTVNFPNAARMAQLSGNPTLEVAIRADGSVEEIIVVRSSGEPELDMAALQILRLAAPFEPFPERFRANYDVLRFAYEWQFLGGKLESGNVRVADKPDRG
jgi:protein TonB